MFSSQSLAPSIFLSNFKYKSLVPVSVLMVNVVSANPVLRLLSQVPAVKRFDTTFPLTVTSTSPAPSTNSVKSGLQSAVLSAIDLFLSPT